MQQVEKGCGLTGFERAELPLLGRSLSHNVVGRQLRKTFAGLVAAAAVAAVAVVVFRLYQERK